MGWGWEQRLWKFSGYGYSVHGDGRGWGSVSVPVQTSSQCTNLRELRGTPPGYVVIALFKSLRFGLFLVKSDFSELTVICTHIIIRLLMAADANKEQNKLTCRLIHWENTVRTCCCFRVKKDQEKNENK